MIRRLRAAASRGAKGGEGDGAGDDRKDPKKKREIQRARDYALANRLTEAERHRRKNAKLRREEKEARDAEKEAERLKWISTLKTILPASFRLGTDLGEELRGRLEKELDEFTGKEIEIEIEIETETDTDTDKEI